MEGGEEGATDRKLRLNRLDLVRKAEGASMEGFEGSVEHALTWYGGAGQCD